MPAVNSPIAGGNLTVRLSPGGTKPVRLAANSCKEPPSQSVPAWTITCMRSAIMRDTTLDTRVKDFLAQHRIAVAGVSRNTSHHPVGNLIHGRLKKTGHDVFAVNPQMATYEGERCYPDVQSIPGGVDGVVIVTRPEITERIVRDCHDAGVRRVWIHQSLGKGSSVSADAVAYCRQHEISVIAGACPMMYGEGADLGHRCMRAILKVTGRLPR